MARAQRLLCALVVLLTLVTGSKVHARIDLKNGDPIPEITLTTINDQHIAISLPSSSMRIFLFGINDHERTQLACKYITEALGTSELEDIEVEWVYIIAKNGDPSKILTCGLPDHEPLIVHDIDRKIFGVFDIIAMPTVVIVDDHATVVYAIPSMTPRFSDVVTDAILFAAHKIDLAEFEQTVHFSTEQSKEERVRAKRILKMAQQASQHGMDEIAYNQFVRAIEIDPSYMLARLALGGYLLEQQKLDEAEEVFEALLIIDQANPDGRLGLASVLHARGGESVKEAKAIIRSVLKNDPTHARAYFMLGLLFEEQGECERAALNFKMASTLLLKTPVQNRKIDN